ncbi:hypothetical protein EC968_010327, partial [Mortierella alpina]
RWSVEVETYQTYIKTEEVDEVVEENEAEVLLAQRKQALTVHGTHVDEKFPIAKRCCVYYDEEEYDDAEVVEKFEKTEEDIGCFVLEKTRTLAGGKKGGSAGLAAIAMAAVMGASKI